MTFIEQIQYLLRDIQAEIKRILERIRANKIYVFTAAIVVVSISIFLIGRYSKDMSGMIGPLISLSVALALNFFYSAFKDIRTGREKLEELDHRSSSLEEYKGCGNDELIRKQVEGLFNKRL